jgi:hypothetical protein
VTAIIGAAWGGWTIHQAVRPPKAATVLIADFVGCKATMALWGKDDDLNVWPRFELLRTAEQFKTDLGPPPKELADFDLYLISGPQEMAYIVSVVLGMIRYADGEAKLFGMTPIAAWPTWCAPASTKSGANETRRAPTTARRWPWPAAMPAWPSLRRQPFNNREIDHHDATRNVHAPS